MKPRIFFWALTSSLAGFLFGFDTVVISGAEQTIQTLWSLSPEAHGIAMASALYGTVLAPCWEAGRPTGSGAGPRSWGWACSTSCRRSDAPTPGTCSP